MNLKRSFFPVLSIAAVIVFLSSSCNKKHHISPPAQTNVDAQVIKDVEYGTNTDWKGNTQHLAMDIYMPENMDKDKKYPLVFFLHGGGFLTGDKRSAATKCSILADSGFIAVSVNYRTGWNKTDDNCNGDVEGLEEAAYRAIQDANAAVRFLVNNANKYSIDTNWIFAGGSSAGAIAVLCMHYLTDQNIRNYYPKAAAKLGSFITADNDLTNTFTIKGISAISGALPDSMLVNSNSSVPSIFFHGEKDETIPADGGYYAGCNKYPKIFGSLCLYRQMKSIQKPVVAHVLPGSGHDDDGGGFDDNFKMSNTACFFHTLMNKQQVESGLYSGVENSCR